jgi:hypothetical protein
VSDGYSRAPLLTKGAFIQLTEGVAGPTPNVIVFQYNPEAMTRKLTPWQPPAEDAAAEQGGQTDPQVQPYDPEETIDIAIEFDCTDQLEDPERHPGAVLYGVADRLSALERLLYPVTEGDGLLGDLAASLAGTASAAVVRTTVPVVLFAWGPGLVVPVRLVSYSVEEQAFSTRLYPIRAKVSVSLQVLTDQAFPESGENAQSSLAADIARAAYRYTSTQRRSLAVLNAGNTLDAVLGLLPS